MKKLFLYITSIVVSSIVLMGCATLFGKSSYPVSVNSNPSGATISITDKKGKEVYRGASPATVSLKSGAGFFSRAEYQVKISAKGFAEQIVPINFKLNGWYFGNLFLGGVLGMLIVDPATGAMWKLETPPVNVTLKSSNAQLSHSLKIIDINTITIDERKSLVRLK